MNIHHHLDPFDDPLLSSISLVSRLSRSSSSIMMMRKQMSLLALVLSLSLHTRDSIHDGKLFFVVVFFLHADFSCHITLFLVADEGDLRRAKEEKKIAQSRKSNIFPSQILCVVHISLCAVLLLSLVFRSSLVSQH